MLNWLRVLSNLLPRGRAWKLWPGSRIRAFFEGLLNGTAVPARDAIDATYRDIWPASTEALREWEAQWGLSPGTLTEQQRRDRMQAQWRALGGQSPRYIQDTLRGAGFDVYIHEWWEPGTFPPQARNPLAVLDGSPGYPLVNIIDSSEQQLTSVSGNQTMSAGNPRALSGRLSGYRFERRPYDVPLNPDTWPFFLYIGGQVFPDVASVPASRRTEFETLCLKICPAQQWLGVLVEYV